jgi:pimeloyl-ACP methyl ester carboxylesterase
MMLACAIAAWGAPAITPELKEQLRDLYAPARVDFASLAPDGRHVAFAVREERGLELRIFNTTNASRKVAIRPDGEAITGIFFLGWADGERLVIMTGKQVAVVNPTNGRVRRLADPAVFAPAVKTWRSTPRVRVIGLSAGPAPALLAEVEATHDESTSLELHRLDLATGAHARVFAEEILRPGGSLLTDRDGKVRLVFSGGENPQRFAHYAEPERKRDRDLDELLANREQFAFSVRPENYLGERTIPLGFGTDPNLLYYASNLGRDAYGLRAVNLTTGQPTGWLAEEAGVDLVDLNAPWVGSPLVFDRTTGALAGARFVGATTVTRWFDPALAALQAEVDKDFPGREVKLVDWDNARARGLVLVSSPGDPGRYFVHDRPSGHNTEYARNAPDLDPELANAAEPFAIATGSAPVQGWLTWPRTPRTDPPPVVVWFHDGPLRRGQSGGGRNAAALATLGFAVIEINYAGASGEGRARRDALRGGYDTVPVAEAEVALDWLVARRPFARGKVAVVGEGYGGYLAMRAVQLRPDLFQAAVAINAPTDLADFWQTNAPDPTKASLAARPSGERLGIDATEEEVVAAGYDWQNRALAAMTGAPEDFHREFIRWYVEQGRPLAEVAVTPQADRLVRPLFLLSDPENIRAPWASMTALRKALGRYGRSAKLLELSPGLTRAELIQEVAGFLEDNLAAPPARKRTGQVPIRPAEPGLGAGAVAQLPDNANPGRSASSSLVPTTR